MAWSSLTITRENLDAYEGATFNDYAAATDLGIASNDGLVLSEAKSELEDDIIDRMGTPDYTNAELLDALMAADDRGLLKRMLTYRFLRNWFFQDAAREDSMAYRKAVEYHSSYYRVLNGALSSLAPQISKPRNTPRFKMVR